jgi:hypothetical protein
MRRSHACNPAPRGALYGAALVLGMLVLAAPLARAQATIEDGGRFEVRSAFLEPAEGVYQLQATLDLSLSSSATQALREGVPVSLELDIAVERRRRWLPDEEVAFLVQRWQIQYHALSGRYLVSNLNSGQQTSYSSLGTALAALAHVRGLPVIDEALLGRTELYEISMRAVAAVEGGLPDAIRIMMFWVDWKRATEWYTWTLTA